MPILHIYIYIYIIYIYTPKWFFPDIVWPSLRSLDLASKATDVAARGLDVPGIEHIVNFDLPNDGGPAMQKQAEG